MIRISAIEEALPDDLRKATRAHPFLVIAAGALAGFYLGRSHGRAILSALVGVGITAVSFWNWRCPACRSYLGKTTDARHCRRCGVELWR